MDNRQIARTLWTMADLYAVDGANTFKVAALKRAAEEIAATDVPFAHRPAAVRDVAGVGSSIASLVIDIVQHGSDEAIRRLHLGVPPSVAEILAVRGIGPKTAGVLYRQLGIRSLSDLRDALQSGSLNGVPGLGPKRLQQLREDLAGMSRRAGTIPIAVVWPIAQKLAQLLAAESGVSAANVTGEARRLVVQPSRVECIVATSDRDAVCRVVRHFDDQAKVVDQDSSSSTVDFHLSHGSRDVPGRVWMTSPAVFPYEWIRTTGDSVHVEVVSQLAVERGYQWQNGLLWRPDGESAEAHSEADVYNACGLPYYPPELREGKGMLQHPTTLVDQHHIQGDLHAHSLWSDGGVSIRDMAIAARARGYAYVAITDHSQSLSIAGGLTPERLRQQAEEIRAVREELGGIAILHGVEVDILSDGSLDLPDDLLWDLDIVIASVHSAMRQSSSEMTDRLVRAAKHPCVDILGHLTGRLIGRREPYACNVDAILEAAASGGVCLELNSNPNRLDATDTILREAARKGVLVSINTDAHDPRELAFLEYGIRMARRGWLQPSNVLNTRSLPVLLPRLHRLRHGHASVPALQT